MTEPTLAAPAGWYPDVNVPGTERYWDGTAWTAQSRPIVTATPVDTTVIEPPAKRKRKWPWIVAGSIAAVLLLIIIIGTANAKPDPVSANPPAASEPAASEPAAEPVAEPTEEPTPEPEPEPESGSLENPFPIGYAVTITQSEADYYTMTAKLISADAGAMIAEANQFNDPAPAGMQYALVEFTFTGAAEDDSVNPGVELYSWQMADQAGKLFTAASIVTPGESISGSPDLYKGQTFTGQEAYLVPVGSSKLFMSALGSYLALN